MIPENYQELQNVYILTANNQSRINTMINRLKKLNIKSTIFDNNGHNASIGHMRIIEKLKNENVEYGVILEDDACFMNSFENLYKDIIKELNFIKIEWDMLYFGGNILCQPYKSKQITNHIIQPQTLYCNHAYIIHNRAFDKVLNGLKTSLLIVDDTYTRLGLTILLTNPMIITQLPPDCTYEDTIFHHQIMINSYDDDKKRIIK